LKLKAIDPSKVVKANSPGSAANVGADQLIAFARDRIGSMKAPKSVDFVRFTSDREPGDVH
jgi:hypothetical protein